MIVSHVEAPPPQLSPEFARYQPLLDKMMAKEPLNRTQTGKEILEWFGSSSSSVTPQDAFELDFSPDFEPIGNSPLSHEPSQPSPYIQTRPKSTNIWKILLPLSLLLLLGVYFLFVNPADKQNQTKPAAKEGAPRSGQNRMSAKEEPDLSPEQNLIREIEEAIQQGELSLAEAKLNSLSEDQANKAEQARLEELLKNKDQENKQQQYTAQLTIAEAALNSGDLSAAETALSNARKIHVGSDLIRLESLLQQKFTFPDNQKLDTPGELQPDPAEDDRYFLRAKMSRSQERISEYLQKFPNGRHRAEAESLAKKINPSNSRSEIRQTTQQINQRTVFSLALPTRPAKLSEATISQILHSGHFFEQKRNSTGTFDNPLEQMNVNGATTFFDPGLNILWLAGKIGESLTYDEALRFVSQLNKERFAGHDDWRIPTLAEAVSLLRPKTAGSPNYSAREFPVPNWIWSSDYRDENYNWAVFYNKGIVDVYRKTDRLNIVAVKRYSTR